MSYILDALRRAEKERNQTPATAPQIVTQNGQPVLRKGARPPWSWMLLGFALALMLVGLLAWLMKGGKSEPVDSAPAPEALAPAAPAAPNTQAIAADDAPAIATLDDLVDSEAAMPPAPGQPEAAEAPRLQPFDAAAQAAPAEPPPAAKAEDSPQPQTSSQSIELQPAPEPAFKMLKDMPTEYRNDFPKLSVQVHSYDDDPAIRFVMINGHRYREGDSLAEGPQIAVITAEGIIFSFKGAEVLVPVY